MPSAVYDIGFIFGEDESSFPAYSSDPIPVDTSGSSFNVGTMIGPTFVSGDEPIDLYLITGYNFLISTNDTAPAGSSPYGRFSFYYGLGTASAAIQFVIQDVSPGDPPTTASSSSLVDLPGVSPTTILDANFFSLAAHAVLQGFAQRQPPTNWTGTLEIIWELVPRNLWQIGSV